VKVFIALLSSTSWAFQTSNDTWDLGALFNESIVT